jgi:hypothetical protein
LTILRSNLNAEDVDAADSSREVGVVLLADVVAGKPIPTLNRLANSISVRTLVKDKPLHSLGSDMRLQSTFSLHRDLT